MLFIPRHKSQKIGFGSGAQDLSRAAFSRAQRGGNGGVPFVARGFMFARVRAFGVEFICREDERKTNFDLHTNSISVFQTLVLNFPILSFDIICCCDVCISSGGRASERVCRASTLIQLFRSARE